MNLPDLFPYLAIIISLAVPLISFYAGVSAGVRKERIRLYGNTLPRFENPPYPVPDKYGWTPIEIRQPEYYKEVLAHLEDGGMCIVWRASDGEKDIYTVQCSDIIVDPIYWRPLPDFIIPKRVGTPTMPNHPPMPDEEALLKAKERMAARPNPRSLQGNYQPKGVIEEQARAFAEDYIKEHPEATSMEAWQHGYSLALRMSPLASPSLTGA
jgi:hypothetical protein